MNEKAYSIDWLRGTSDCFKLNDLGYPSEEGILFFNDLLKVMGIHKTLNDYDIEGYGELGYHKTIFIEDGIKIFFDSKYNKNRYGNETFCLDISGEGCDFFKTNASWFHLLDFLYSHNFKFTRIDAAIDDFYGLELKRVDIQNCLLEENYIKRGTYEPVFFGRVNDPNNDKGYTVNLYAPSSNVQLRIYDKAAERRDKVGYLAETPQWIRYEMQFNRDNAELFVKQYYLLLLKNEEKSISKLLSANLNSLFRIVVPGCDSNKSRWKTDPRWEKFIGDVETVEFDRKIVRRSPIDSLKEYIELNYSKAFAKILLCKGYDFFKLWIKDVAINGLKNLDDQTVNEINSVRYKSGYKKLSRNDIVEIKVLEELKKEEKEILKTWGTNSDVKIHDITREQLIVDSLLYNLNRDLLNNGEVVIRTDDVDLVNLIRNYLGGSNVR